MITFTRIFTKFFINNNPLHYFKEGKKHFIWPSWAKQLSRQSLYEEMAAYLISWFRLILVSINHNKRQILSIVLSSYIYFAHDVFLFFKNFFHIASHNVLWEPKRIQLVLFVSFVVGNSQFLGLDIWLHLFSFLPHSICWHLYLWRLERNYWRKEENRWRYLLDFNFISGFSNHFVGDEILPETSKNGCVSQTRCKNTWSHFQ